MAGPEAIDWVARLNRQLEPLHRAGQQLARDLEQVLAAVRDSGSRQRLLRAWQQLSKAIVAARDQRNPGQLQTPILQELIGGIVQHVLAAKGNPAHRKARVWLQVMQLTPIDIEKQLPRIFKALMDTPDLRIPARRGRPRRQAADTPKLVGQLDKRIKRTGERPTTAAKGLLTARGVRAPALKSRADHLVRVWRKSRFKIAMI